MCHTQYGQIQEDECTLSVRSLRAFPQYHWLANIRSGIFEGLLLLVLAAR
jgi:hypothetical protein